MKKSILLITIFLIHSQLFAGEWQVKKNAKNLVQFTSTTPLLDFDGITNMIDGYMYSEGKTTIGKNTILYFEVNLNSVETGIGKRDRDMREEVLETHRWPTTYFQGTISKIEKMDVAFITYNIVVQGKIFIHGVEREMEIPGKIIIKDDIINVQSDFSVFLKDFNIEAPSLLAFIKVAEEIKLHLNFYLEEIKQ